MEVTTETVVTREEFPVLFEKELKRLLQDTPGIKYQLTGMMVESFAKKTDLQAVLERIDAQGERIEAQGERIEAQGERIEALREDFNRQFAEHSRRMDAMEEQIKTLREDFNRGFALLSERIDTLSREVGKVDSHIGALGSRWGLMTESAFRDGLADILAQEAGLKVMPYHKMDTAGFVFGRPDQVEIDVVIQNGEHTLIEIKSSTSRQEVHSFARKVDFYEQEEGVKARRMIIISPMLGPGAEELASDLGIETFTSAYDVSA